MSINVKCSFFSLHSHCVQNSFDTVSDAMLYTLVFGYHPKLCNRKILHKLLCAWNWRVGLCFHYSLQSPCGIGRYLDFRCYNHQLQLIWARTAFGTFDTTDDISPCNVFSLSAYFRFGLERLFCVYICTPQLHSPYSIWLSVPVKHTNTRTNIELILSSLCARVLGSPSNRSENFFLRASSHRSRQTRTMLEYMIFEF